MSDASFTPALALLPPPSTARPQSEVESLVAEYERWASLDQLCEEVSKNPQYDDDRRLRRKAFAISEEVITELGQLREKLSVTPSGNIQELARKARILELDVSHWLSEDPLLYSVCSDAMGLAGIPPIPHPYPIASLLQRLRKLEFEAPPLPSESQS